MLLYAACCLVLHHPPALTRHHRCPAFLQDAASPRLADFCRKCVALSAAQQRAGDAPAALASLARCTAALLRLGFEEPAAWRPLVQEFARLQADLPQQAASPAAQPAKRGRGAASKKAPAARAADPAADGDSSTAAAELLLVERLQQHAAQLPQGSITAVLEAELQCWAAQEGTSSSSGTTVQRLARRLLQDVYPAAQQPLQHAGVLLALHQSGLPAEDGQSGAQLLERAVAVLGKVGGRE